MQYDFTTVLDREKDNFIAVDILPYKDVEVENGFPRIPMWVADMSFPTCPAILQALEERLQMPNFGYFHLSDEYYNSIIRWHKERKHVTGIQKEHISYENGVLGGVSSVMQALTAPGDKVLVHSPVYVGFLSVFESTGRVPLYSQLVRDKEGIWRMDYEDMDKKLKENNIHLAIFCSPHNPCGRVWEKWEIEKAMEVYRKNDCIVISDEIWSDIIMPGHVHTATQSVSEDAKNRTIAFYAPSKTFSLAGLIGSYSIIYNKYLRDRVVKQGEMTHYNSCNTLSMAALIGAYSKEGSVWTDEMISVIEENLTYACDFFRNRYQGIRVMKSQGTYMLYLDLSGYCEANHISIHEIQERAVKKGVIWQDGEPFMLENTIRMNLALPKSLLAEALERIRQYVLI